MDNTGDKEIVARVMFGLGRSAAIGIFNSHIAAGIKSETLEDVMHLHWAEIGLGMMSIWTGENEKYIIQNKRSTEALSLGETGEPSCNFSKGYLIGLAFAHNNMNYKVVERECMCMGHENCTFDLFLDTEAQQ